MYLYINGSRSLCSEDVSHSKVFSMFRLYTKQKFRYAFSICLCTVVCSRVDRLSMVSWFIWISLLFYAGEIIGFFSWFYFTFLDVLVNNNSSLSSVT